MKSKTSNRTMHSFFSPDTNLFYKLFETDTLPCLEISGIRMHCFGKSSVLQTTKQMASFLSPLEGIVLDTCCGLGYTAIEIAKNSQVQKVYTFEIDSNVLELAKVNKPSAELFSSKKIVLKNSNVLDEIKNFDENFFDRILHDPPVISIAGELYGRPFYKELLRVLKKGGKLYHYTGLTGSKKGIDLIANTILRLEEIGFKNIVRVEEPAGIVCEKI